MLAAVNRSATCAFTVFTEFNKDNSFSIRTCQPEGQTESTEDEIAPNSR